TLPDVLPKMMQLQPRQYLMKYNNPDHHKSIGFIAQEVQETFPELVSIVDGNMVGYTEIPDMHTVNYSQLSVLAIRAIQEQQAIIEKQQQQINELIRDIKLLKEKTGQ
ncbi:MAG TPA: tail fiber domain-containing protein, partial [Flavitalea sp.]|nr:tail fiber domain-containing protein [Flavitalea sp.]